MLPKAKPKNMAAKDYSQFHELAEQFRGEIPLKKICEQEGVSYRSYISWRSREGLSPRIRRSKAPEGLVEMVAVDDATTTRRPSPMATAVHIEFENGLRFDRDGMDVDSLVEFLTKIRGAICLG